MNERIELINKSIKYIDNLLNRLDEPFDELTKEAIEGYGLDEIKKIASSEDPDKENLDGALLSIVNIFDVLDEELCLDIDFYDLKDDVETLCFDN